MKRIIIFTMVMALILGLSSVAFAEGYSDLMTTAKNSFKAKMYGDALDYAQQALKLKQNGDANTFALLGDIYFEQKSYAQAKENWQNALVFKISDPVKFKANVAGKFFALGVNNLGNIQTAKELFGYAIGFGYSSAEITKAMKSYGENIIRQAQNREEGLRAVSYVGQARVDVVFPGPKWEPVLERTLVGKGYVDDGAVLIAKFGTEIKPGYKVSLVSENGEKFDVVWNGKWVTKNGAFEFTSECQEEGGFSMAAKEGLKVALKIQKSVQLPKQEHLVASNN